MQKALSKASAIAVVDRDFSYGSPFYGGVVFNEIRSVLYGSQHRPIITNYIAGLGGREISTADMIKMYEDTIKAREMGHDGRVTWIGVRE
jgi:pyruvate ferredoxin oxidoreductase alpha subunit